MNISETNCDRQCRKICDKTKTYKNQRQGRCCEGNGVGRNQGRRDFCKHGQCNYGR